MHGKYCVCEAARGRRKESLQPSLSNFYLYFAQTKGNTIGWKMTFRKLKLIDNRPSRPALNIFVGNETRCSFRQKPVLCRRSRSSLRKRKPAEEENRFLLLWETTVVCVVVHLKSNLDLRPVILQPREAEGLVWCYSGKAVWNCWLASIILRG